MSSEVQAKWMNSVAATSSGTSLTCSLSQYSTALTSWLVTASIALMRAASASVKSAAILSSRALASFENGLISANPACDSACSQEISTFTRWCMKPASDRIGRSLSVLAA